MIQLIRVVDLETTGGAPPEHVPIEIGWCDLVGTGPADLFDASQQLSWQLADDGVETRVDSMLVRALRPIPPEASAVHHLVDADIADGADWAVARATALHAPAGHAIAALAAHACATERQWLTPAETGDLPWICTYKCALRHWPQAPGHGNQVLRYWLNPEGLARVFAMPAHRAGPDAYVTAFILRALMREVPLATLIAWTAEPALFPRIPFGRYKGQPWADQDDGFLEWCIDTFTADGRPGGAEYAESVRFSARHELARREKQVQREAEASDDAEARDPIPPDDYDQDRS